MNEETANASIQLALSTPILAPVPRRPINGNIISDEILDQLPGLEDMSESEDTFTPLGSPLMPLARALDLPMSSDDEDACAPLTAQSPARSPPALSCSPSLRLRFPRPSSTSSDADAGVRRLYSCFQPEYPPTDKFFSVQRCQEDNAIQRVIRQRNFDLIYPGLLDDPGRIVWESRFMGSFWWYSWRDGSTEAVLTWVQEHGLDRDWSEYAKGVFRETLWSVYDSEAWRRLENEPVCTLDFITRTLKRAFVAVGIHNLAIMRCFDSCYTFFPIGHSRPVYSRRDLGIVEREFVERWYPQYLEKVVQGPNESEAGLGVREYRDLLNCVESYYGYGKPPATLTEFERFLWE